MSKSNEIQIKELKPELTQCRMVQMEKEKKEKLEKEHEEEKSNDLK